jgi:N-methylhydantoinase B
MTATPVEVWEDITNITYLRKVLSPDSGGPGKYRGGLGQEIAIRNDSEHLMTVDFFGQCTDFPAQGINCGRPGKLRRYSINGKKVHPKAQYVLKPGDEFRITEAGGGGYGDPSGRPVEKVLEDVKNGFATVEGALSDYGVRVDLVSGTAEKVKKLSFKTMN